MPTTRSAARSTSTCYGVITGTQLAIERMRPRGSGHIVNIASQAGKAGIPGIATYSATKHAVVGLSEAVRAELRGSGVEVPCVMPTVVNTELTSGRRPEMGQTGRGRRTSPTRSSTRSKCRASTSSCRAPTAALYTLRCAAAARAGARRSAGLMKVDKLMLEVDHGARRAYEERAAASEPSADAARRGAGAGAARRRLSRASVDRRP